MLDILSFDANSIITLLVGFIAFGVYSKQKWDKKRNAAKAIFIEIQTAEMNLEKIKEELSKDDEYVEVPENIFLMPIESWSTNRQDFIKDFRSDEWSAIDKFYSKCKFYDQNARYNSQAFVKNEEQIRVNAHRLVADYVGVLAEKIFDANVDKDSRQTREELTVKAFEEFQEKSKFIKDRYLRDITKPMYRPQKYLDQARVQADAIESLLLGTIGKKLDSIANRGWIRNILHLYFK
jgi:hypothetical protein